MSWWEMAGHGGYVWTAYGIALVIGLWLVLHPWYRQRQFFARANRDLLQAAEQSQTRQEPDAQETETNTD